MQVSSFLRLVSLIVVGATIFAATAVAQVTTGSLSGTVVDPTGAVVSDATVTLINQGSGAKQQATTSSSGAFRFTFLSVGRYDLEISKPGFRSLKSSGIAVDANIEHTLGSLKMDVGQTTESVEVSSAAPLVESAQAQVSTAITGEALQTFAGVGENEGADFIALTLPGVAASRDNNFSNANGVGFTVNGIRGRNNDQQIDGQNNNDNSVAGPALFVSDVDFVNEYQATTSNFGPEYGRNSGSVINVVTKNGTNRWHGTVFGDETNSVFTSLTNIEKSFEGVTKPPRFNQEFTGGSIGGPLLKNKVFVFGGFDNQIDSSSAFFSTGALIPTPNGIGTLAGCFPGSASITALSNLGPYAVGGAPTVAGAPQTAYFDNAPVNNTTDPTNGDPACGYQLAGIQRFLPNGFHIYDWITRLDVHATDSDSLYVRYLYQRENFFNVAVTATSNAAGYPVNVPSLGQSGLIGWTHTFNNRMLNEFRVGYSRNAVQFGSNTVGSVPLMSNVADAMTSIGFTNSTLLGFGPASNFPEGRIVNSYQLQDNFSYTKGQHQLKWGANITNQRSPNVFLPGYNGIYTFSDWGAYAANTPSSTTLDEGNPEYPFKEWDTFLYVGDDWKVRHNLTLNLGLTWSYLGQPANLFHQETVAQQTGSNPVWLPSLPLSATTTPSIPALHNLFGPSIGFAWSPDTPFTRNGNTVIRGGYRLTYDPAFYNIFLNDATTSPAVLGDTFAGPGLPGVPASPLGPSVRAAYATLLPFGQLDPRNSPEVTINPHLSPDRVHEWSLGIQRNVAKDAAFEVRYVGNHGENLFQSVDVNPYIQGLASAFPSYIPAGDTPCPTASAVVPAAVGRVNCNTGIQLEVGNSGYSNYDGLQAEFRTSNIFRQLTLRTSYTWSKTMDNVSEIFNTFAGGNSETYAQNPLNVKGGEYSLSGIDFPQTWTLSFIEDVPFMRAQRGLLGHIAGGWAVSGTYILQSGQNYTPTQFFINSATSPIEDVAFDQAFNNTVPDVVRPFVGSTHAPATQVGIFAGDACVAYGAGCSLAPTSLVSLNGINNGAVAQVTNSQVRFIANGGEAETVFGVPFGNVRRNSVRDYHTDLGNFTAFKNFKFWERATLQWHMTMNNVFNHPNYGNTIPGISTFIESAGAGGAGAAFADPTVQSDANLSCPAGARCVYFGLKVIY
jgi:Carboxypeptidase regulatory-like domain